MNRNFNVIFKYSYANKVKSKSFIVLTIIILILSLFISFGPPIIDKIIGDDPKVVGILTSDPNIVSSLDSFDQSGNTEFVAVESTKNLTDYEYVIDLDKNIVYSEKELSTDDKLITKSILDQLYVKNTAESLNISEGDLLLLNKGADISYNVVDTTASVNTGPMYIINFILVIVSYFILIIGMQGVGQEVMEEKTSRAMEVIITNVSPIAHLSAKVFANLLFMFTIILEFVVFTIITYFISRFIFTDSINILEIIKLIFTDVNSTEVIKYLLIAIPMFISTLITTYLLVAILASTISTTEEYQAAILPVTLYLVVGYIVGISVTSLAILKVISYLPIINFYILPSLVLQGNASTLNIVISMSVSILFLVLTFVFGSKIYREGVLNYSSKGFRKIMKQAFRKKVS